jgi:hypothetical protein
MVPRRMKQTINGSEGHQLPSFFCFVPTFKVNVYGFILFYFFETRFHYVVQVGLELTM